MSSVKKSDPQNKKQPKDAVHPSTEAFIEVLQALGRVAADLHDNDAESTLRQCQQWAQRLRDGAASSAATESMGSETEWQAAQQFALELVKHERDFAVTRVDDFRQMMWVVIQGLREAFRGEQSVDREVVQHLDRLRSAADSDSIDELRGEVVAAVVMIGRAIDDRRKDQRHQLEELGGQLNRMRAELLKAQREMALEPMTRLYNRTSFDELLEKTIELSIFSGQASCLLMIDIDNFKSINDEYGHVCGDEAVLKVADCLKKTFPRKTDFVARYGGDEFAIILQDTDLRDGEMLAKRLLGLVRELKPTSDKGEEVSLSVSIGVSDLRNDDTARGWIGRADQALYQAKRAGRGCVWMASTEEQS